MTAPLFLVERGALDDLEPGAQVVLAGAEARHAVQVRRLVAGERIDLADGAGRRVEGTVAQVDTTAKAPSLIVRVAVSTLEPEASPRLVLVQALAKGDRDLSAIEAATELGVDVIVPWQAERSIVVWRGDRATKSQHRWAATVLAAAKQSRRARVPLVESVVGLAELAELVAASALALLLHEDADHPLVGVALPAAGDVLLIVGPEGGVGERELGRLVEAGARPVRLGHSVLRSSTAGPAALAVLSARSRWT